MQRPLCKTGCLSERYRSFTGECNNRQHPKWGAANTPYSRWLPPEYEDIRGVPRGWDPEHTYYNYTLPPVRLISQNVLYTHNENISLDSSLSHLLVEWGQWIDHDFALTPQSPSTAAFRTGADCTRTCSRDTPCFPIQILTWEHYLPRVLGETPTSLLMPPYKGYDPEIDPSIANVFSAAAFRFAHVTVQPMVARLGPGYSLAPQHPPLPLHHSLFASWRVVQEGGIDPVLRGLLLSPAKLQMPGQMMVEELTERLFQAQGGMPLDLGALNLQRGRDHGLPGYSSWRGLCGLSVPNTTSDLAGILGNPGLAEKFLLLYGTSQNIDVWVGAISEPPLPGGRVGPLLACLLAKQFRALRDGDRFWWEREAVFTSTQRAQLHTVSLSRIICDNTHITRVPSDPFSRTVSPEDMLACSHPLIPHLNLSAWKEPDTDPSCGPIPRLQSGFSLLCDSVIYYQCGPGYQLIGPSSVTCDPNSYQWSPAPPICHGREWARGVCVCVCVREREILIKALQSTCMSLVLYSD
uniref:Eosinophil peroxidase n=1 Tax=Oncorhynchus kisutch TaxID=8019 RepID=A0A8C7G3X0_ONCKI